MHENVTYQQTPPEFVGGAQYTAYMLVELVIYPTLDRDIDRLAAPSYHNRAGRQHAEVPIEGVGVVHVITEVTDDDPGYGFTDVTLERYRNGVLHDHIPVTGSTCESAVAEYMHQHWCDPVRLIKCIRGDTDALYLLDIDFELDQLLPQSPDAAQSADTDTTPRVLALIARAKSRYVRIPELRNLAAL